MKTFGLIGKNLSHSFSPDYFQNKFEQLNIDAQYVIFEFKQITEFQKLIRERPGISGLNVTIPYKIEIIPFLNELDVVASQIGSVNTIQVIQKNKNLILIGYNTDVLGFEKTLLNFLDKKDGIKALILGTGGSAAAVQFVLTKLQILYLSVSRKPKNEKEISYKDLSRKIIQENNLIINTTPIGMFPGISEAPIIPYQFLGKEHFLYDLIYNPIETEFLKRGKKQGAKTKNGMDMLTNQAEEAWKIWNQT
jgi:shikimate dehydrogenase